MAADNWQSPIARGVQRVYYANTKCQFLLGYGMRITHYLGSPVIETRNSNPEFYSVYYNNAKLDNSWVWTLGGNFTAVIPILNLNVTVAVLTNHGCE